MLEECREIVKNEKVDVTVFTGDFFHYKHGNPHWLVNKAMATLKEWRGTKLAIVGNHDLTSAGLGSVFTQPIGTLFISGSLHWLEQDLKISTYNNGGIAYGDSMLENMIDSQLPESLRTSLRVQFSPANYLDDIDDKPELLGLTREDNADWTIKVAHASIVVPGMDYPFTCVPMDTVPTDGIDLFLFGHLHHYTPITQVNGTTFAGLGSLGRTGRADYNYMRTPKVLMVEFTKEEMKLTEIPLKSAVTPEELFYSKAGKSATESAMETFIRNMDHIVKLEEASIEDALDEVLDDTVEKPVVVRVKKHLGDAGW